MPLQRANQWANRRRYHMLRQERVRPAKGLLVLKGVTLAGILASVVPTGTTVIQVHRSVTPVLLRRWTRMASQGPDERSDEDEYRSGDQPRPEPAGASGHVHDHYQDHRAQQYVASGNARQVKTAEPVTKGAEWGLCGSRNARGERPLRWKLIQPRQQLFDFLLDSIRHI